MQATGTIVSGGTATVYTELHDRCVPSLVRWDNWCAEDGKKVVVELISDKWEIIAAEC